MYDPIGGFDRIRELYITYLETAFRIGNAGVSAERRALLESPGTLCTEPLLEPVARYRSVDWTLRELAASQGSCLPDFEPEQRAAFVRLVSSGLFDSADARLYEHQAVMLQRGTREGMPGIVTSGTGSGKTESFLLPVLATIAREATGERTRWPAPAPTYMQRRWWHDSAGRLLDKYTAIPRSQRPSAKNPDADPFTPHRAGETRWTPCSIATGSSSVGTRAKRRSRASGRTLAFRQSRTTNATRGSFRSCSRKWSSSSAPSAKRGRN
jgi:hypothetical protein